MLEYSWNESYCDALTANFPATVRVLCVCACMRERVCEKEGGERSTRHIHIHTQPNHAFTHPHKTRVHACAHTHIRLNCTNIYTHTHTHTHTHVHTHTHPTCYAKSLMQRGLHSESLFRNSPYIYTYICIYIRIYICMYTYIHIHICI